MGTTIETGSNSSSITTSKLRFTKGPGEVTEVLGSTDRVTLGEVDHGDRPLRFRDLDRATRSEYKETVKELAEDGRLFVREDSGSLRRADPMEIKERLDHGEPVEVVSQVASESRSSGDSASRLAYKERGIFTGGYENSSSSSHASSSQRVFYTTSPITEWDSLEFASEGRGVLGVSHLPPSGNSVEISSSYEAQWQARANEQWGIFTDKERDSQSSGFVRRHTTAD